MLAVFLGVGDQGPVVQSLISTNPGLTLNKIYGVKVTVQFERCFRLMEHISVISCCNPINLYITEKLIKFSKSLFNFYFPLSTREI